MTATGWHGDPSPQDELWRLGDPVPGLRPDPQQPGPEQADPWSRPDRWPAGTSWPEADPRFERACKRLLRAYPRDYRRRHGAEVVTTLLEMAEPGRRRPAGADAWHLIGSGIRQRFRLPARRPLAWVAAVLVMLIGGAFGAAAGSWAVEQAFLRVPDPQAAAALHRAVSGSPGAELSRTIVDPSPSPWSTDAVGWSSAADPSWDAEAARARLAADGWRLSASTPWPPIEARRADEQAGQRPLTGWEFDADRDGVLLSVSGFTIAGDADNPAEASVSTMVSPAGSAALIPAIVLGGAAGLLTGWLLAAAAARRIRHRPAARARTAAALATTTILTLAVPAVALYGNVLRVFTYDSTLKDVYTVHSALKLGGPYWPSTAVWLNLALTVLGAALALATLAASRTRPEPQLRWTEEAA
ncbi:hypothetical protein [Actinoplanes sp. NPDC023714]|uniref:hypothetical protein n=1 Tax=Actinoplanes sp. NPDC023714 TaxID=3154322 RepID=UPI003406E02D